MSADDWVPLAEIARPHGVRGEVRLRLFNKASDTLLGMEEVLVRLPDGEEHEVSVDRARRADDAILMKLHSVDDRDRADELRGALVCVRRKDFPPPEEGEFYAIDVVGAEARLEGARVGVVIELVTYPSVEALLVRADDGAGDWEVPLTDTYVAKVDIVAKTVDLVTLFPELFATFLSTSFVGRAIEGGQLEVRTKSPRDFGLGKHRSVDDTPYGGGSGMVMRVDVLVQTMEAFEGEPRARRILMTPQGAPFNQRTAERLAREAAIMLVCGRYEGFDERVRAFVDEEISLGDFVMTGGEVAAMAVIEATVRLLPGVLGNAESTREESHSEEGLLEYPQYTRPAEFREHGVPDVLKNGNHAEIAKWRREQALARTAQRRPDLKKR